MYNERSTQMKGVNFELYEVDSGESIEANESKMPLKFMKSLIIYNYFRFFDKLVSFIEKRLLKRI